MTCLFRKVAQSNRERTTDSVGRARELFQNNVGTFFEYVVFAAYNVGAERGLEWH